MTRSAKIGLGVLAALLLLPVLVVAALLFLVDPNAFKPEIASVVKDKTDMELAIDEHIDWQLWPRIGLRLGKTTLTEPGHGPLLAVHKAAVDVELMPLFGKKVVINAVNVDGAQVNFIQRKDGTTNWDRMLKKLAENPEEESEAIDLNIADVQVKNSALKAVDETTGAVREVKALTLKSQNIDLRQEFPVELGFEFAQTADGKTLLAKNAIKSRVKMDQDNQHFWLNGVELTSALSGSLLPAPVDVKLAGAIDADVKAGLHQLKGLKLNVVYKDPALKSPATVDLATELKANLVDQRVELPALSLNATYPDKALSAPATVKLDGRMLADLKTQLVQVTGLKLAASYPQAGRPAPITASFAGDISTQLDKSTATLSAFTLVAVLPDKQFPKPLRVDLNGAVNANWAEGVVALSNATLKALNVVAQVKADATLPMTGADGKAKPMEVRGNLATNTFDARAAMAALGMKPPVMRDPKALKAVSLSANIVGDERSLMLKDLAIRLDDTRIRGEAGISDLKTLRQYARLNVDGIDVDRYMAPESATPAPAASPKPAAASAGVIPVETLRGLNMDAAVTVGSLRAMGYSVSNAKLNVDASKGRVNLRDVSGTVFNGGFNVKGVVDASGAQPKLALTPSLRNLDIAPLAKQMLGKDLLAGRVNYEGQLNLTGNSTDAWVRSLGGVSNVKLENGLLRGMNLTDLVIKELGSAAQFLPLLTGKDAATLVSKQNDTEIANLAADASINQGVVSNKGLNADLRKGKLNGSGNFNIVTKEVDYHFQLALDKSLIGEKYAGYAIPVRCKGNLLGNIASLCKPDGRALREMLVKAAAEKQLGGKLAGKLGVSPEAVADPKKAAEEAAKARLDEEKKKAEQKLQDQLMKKLKLF